MNKQHDHAWQALVFINQALIAQQQLEPILQTGYSIITLHYLTVASQLD